MSILQSEALIKSAIKKLVVQINNSEILEFNKAIIQHYLALQLRLLNLEADSNLQMTIKKRVRLETGYFRGAYGKTAVFGIPKKRKQIDIFFKHTDGTRCAVELRVFKRENHREPNNRYDAFADIGNLEIYNDNFTDIGFFLLLSDHPHYFDKDYRSYSRNTSDFDLRDGSIYIGDSKLIYNTSKPYGPPLSLSNSYKFNWMDINDVWKILLVKVH